MKEWLLRRPFYREQQLAPEQPLTKQEVIATFSVVYERFRQETEPLRERLGRGEQRQQFSLEEQLQIFDFFMVQSAVQKVMGRDQPLTADRESYTFPVPFTHTRPDGTEETLATQEGIPVDPLMRFLNREDVRLNEAVEIGAIDRETFCDRVGLLVSELRVLLGASEYFDYCHPEVVGSHSKIEGRKRLEAVYVDRDPFRRTGTPKGDWNVAQTSLLMRRELIVPAA